MKLIEKYANFNNIIRASFSSLFGLISINHFQLMLWQNSQLSFYVDYKSIDWHLNTNDNIQSTLMDIMNCELFTFFATFHVIE